MGGDTSNMVNQQVVLFLNTGSPTVTVVGVGTDTLLNTDVFADQLGQSAGFVTAPS